MPPPRFTALLSALLFTAEASALTLQGSNTVGARLAPACARSFLETKGFGHVISRPGAVENELHLIGRDPHGNERHIDIAAHGSGTAFSGLQDGTADIGMSSRPIKAEEAAMLTAAGDMRSAAAEHTIAMDGLAILVHPDNPVSQLTTDQVARLFSGEIGNWRDVGGNDAPVSLYARDHKSGTWDTFAGLVLGKRTLSSAARRFESNDELADAVAMDRSGIGFSGLASASRAKVIAVADGLSRAILPTRLSVATEDYPLARRLFLYVRPERSNGEAGALIEHCQSERGQDLVEAIGFVSQNIVELAQETVDNAPVEYRQLYGNARRLSVNFRFHQGSATLDNKAMRDIARLVAYMGQPAQQGRHLFLVGFNDGDGNGRWEQLISRFRALEVQAELMKRGVAIHKMIGLGAFLPVAATGNSNAAAKNGRVEVWISPPLNNAP